MKSEDIKVGQRVCCTGGPALLEGWVGTCTYIASANRVAIEFDKSHMSLHTCSNHCQDGHGWWGNPAVLRPVDVTAPDRETPNDREMSKDQVDVHIARLEDVVETFFTIGVSRQDMLELFNDISKKHFSEKQLRDRIAKIKDKVTKCQN